LYGAVEYERRLSGALVRWREMLWSESDKSDVRGSMRLSRLVTVRVVQQFSLGRLRFKVPQYAADLQLFDRPQVCWQRRCHLRTKSNIAEGVLNSGVESDQISITAPKLMTSLLQFRYISFRFRRENCRRLSVTAVT